MTDTLKIAITCYPSIGGSGIVATELGGALAERGHEVHFISYERPFRLDFSRGNIHFHEVKINDYKLFKYPDYTLPLAVKMCAVNEAHSIDVMHVHYAVPHATAALLAREICATEKCNVPAVVTTLHGTDITLLAHDPTLHSIIRYSIEQSDGVTAVSKALRAETLKLLGIDKDIQTIHNFYSPKDPTKSRKEVRAELGVQEDELLLMHLSNLRPVKRVEDLLRIVSRLKDRPIKLAILAGASFGEYAKQVKELDIEEQVIVRQNVSDIHNYLPAADVGVYTSEMESFGMGILESMSYGLPVLATRVGGVPEVVDEGASGYLYDVGDIDGFVSGVEELRQDADKRAKLGKAAREKAAREFCTKVIVEKYESYYRDILEKSK